MSDLLDAIGTALQNGGAGTLGSTLFLSRQPSSPDAVLTAYETGAGYPMYTQGPAGAPALRISNVQIVARSAREDYPAARAAISSASGILDGLLEQTISGIRILRAEQIGSPSPLGLDDNDRPRISVTYQITHA